MSFFVADLQSVRRNHPVEADLAGQTVEFVAVSVAGAVHVQVMFGDLRGSAVQCQKTHVVFDVIDFVCLGKAGVAMPRTAMAEKINVFSFILYVGF